MIELMMKTWESAACNFTGVYGGAVEVASAMAESGAAMGGGIGSQMGSMVGGAMGWAYGGAVGLVAIAVSRMGASFVGGECHGEEGAEASDEAEQVDKE